MNELKQRKVNKKTTQEETTDSMSRPATTSNINNNKINHEQSSSVNNNNLIENNLFLCVLGVRLLSVLYNLIWDCDETYNYWEQLHYLTYKSGLQTWEYSPSHALRSYLYIFIHMIAIYPLTSLNLVSKISAFFITRFFLACLMSTCETKFYFALKKLNSQNNNLHLYFILLSLSNVGHFTSLTSFLPSSFCMYLTLYSYGKWFTNELNKAVFGIGLASLLGWPFSAILGVPILIDYIFIEKKLFHFIKYVFIFALTILIPLVSFDSFVYGRFVLAPFNIVKYNVFGGNQKGPDLYGREPFSFYIKNLCLNFNLLFFVSVLSIPFLVLFHSNKRVRLSQLGLILWLGVFMTRPHKEERFMYPIYPLFIFNSALFLSYTSRHNSVEKLNMFSGKFISYLILIVHFLLSLSRFLALYFNYSAMLNVFLDFNLPKNKFASTHMQNINEINVCIEKEWYRYPSSFFLPKDYEQAEQIYRLKFLDSEFGGQLPAYYNSNSNSSSSSSILDGTRHIDPLFNDENKRVEQRIFHLGLQRCHFFFDTDNLNDNEFNRLNAVTNWKTILSGPFLDQSHSANSALFKSFYSPYFYEKNVKFTQFKLRARVY
jgi:alpha-1,2-mannosyltransferase